MKLATVERIIGIKPIKDADNIELALVLGWQVVVKKGEFKVGDLAVYVQIDTIAPEKPEYEFLRKVKFRIKTIKLRGELSQGLLLPLPEGRFKEGQDLTDLLEIKKYEKETSQSINEPKPKSKLGWVVWKIKKKLYKYAPFLRKNGSTPFPTELVSITDEPRIQNMPRVLEDYKGQQFILRYKLDGSSITLINHKFLWWTFLRICSRRQELHDKNNEWAKAVKFTNFKKHINKLVKHFNTPNIIVQGEMIGKYNGNHHNLIQPQIRLFNIFVNGVALNPVEFNKVTLELQIPTCPFHSVVTLEHSLEQVLEMSKIPDALNPNVPAEGLVWRSLDGKVSFKAINNDYLLKHE